MESWRDELYHSELYHHGIKGQKWGVRNGPPYPLKAGARSAAEKKGGSPVSDKQGYFPIGLAIYSAYMGVLLLGLGATVVAESIRKKKAKKFNDQCDKEREEAPIDKKTGLKKKTREMTREEDMKRVNPKREMDPGNALYSNNCVLCTTAYEMRRRGYEVQAKEGLPVSGLDSAKKFFPKCKCEAPADIPKAALKDNVEAYKWIREANKKREWGNKELKKAVKESIAKQPEGSRGQVLVNWPDGGGHSMAYEIKNRKMEIIDAQVNKIYKGMQVDELLGNVISFRYQRYDNVKFDAKQIKKGVQ